MHEYLAHISDDGRTQTVDEHLENTAVLAASFAEAFNAREYGYLAGIAHDIGKYSLGFQRRLYGGPKVDHSSAGAVECAAIGAYLTGCCIAGHHGGLPDYGNVTADVPGESTYVGRVKKVISERSKAYSAWKGTLPSVPPEPAFEQNGFARSLWCRMLYSSLVDADFLDTEAFMSGNKVECGKYDDLSRLLERLNEYVGRWKNPTTELNKLRWDILQSCFNVGNSEKGLFSLTVPTGGGKTVASLAFALTHAIRNGMKRIIYVIPYTSIIEQNAEVFRRIVGSDNIVEHHSEAEVFTDEDISSEQLTQALATENWDAPIIVTTAVQFFESLYSNKPSKCRKLHNIANSVIIFDEAQMMPTCHLRPCVAVIAGLVAHFGSSALLCTATQPFLEDLFAEYAPALKIREISREVEATFKALARVTYRIVGKLSIQALVEQLSEQVQVLCIVNTRKRAQEIYRSLPQEGSFHLSTLMYPKHRQETLQKIRIRLQEGKPCRVVSTSLIEAGVDVDFPFVYRELSGLDSIVQAAGRCNREGKRKAEDSIVTVFEGDSTVPKLLKVNIGAAKEALSAFEDAGSPAAIERYFAAYRSLMGNGLDKSSAVKHLTDGKAGCALPFKTVAEDFHMIDTATKTVYIPSCESRSLIEEIAGGRATHTTYRRAGRYGVNIYEDHYNTLLNTGDIIAIDHNSAYLANEALYDADTGLSLSADVGKAEFI